MYKRQNEIQVFVSQQRPQLFTQKNFTKIIKQLDLLINSINY